ncbi:MAG: Unknown protein [uncultured Sulfurovum sp.]|uniref:Dynamin N-terminal domain-containing protein n=1 Tax=uncultured Sulfurovum sp. TaxID=269237 RepID=A0A6S6U0L4_9BACT|nr:MAG: Unknown protein [uncultured Sulfurovum sp.]
MSIVNMQRELEEIISRHQDLIGSEAQNLQLEYAIGTANKTEEALEKINSENRLLQIGILGRVKAGKSSLMNALLFNGKSILPNAATPMTAALTIISYGEELSAEVEFFKQEDIENIKREAKEFELEFTKLKNNALKELKDRRKKKQNFLDKAKEVLEFKELNRKAEKRARREIKSNMTLTSSYDQWQRIKASKVDYTQLPVFETVKSNSLENLSTELLAYVGADGQYMPFTKSVHIKIPQNNLKGIQIVDTPGVNDPVQSREERTRELLKYCDVVFIVSPSGQFMSSEDLDLMDRITSKEGIRELYVLASQADLQLFGSVKEESDGELQQAFNNITTGLAKHLHNTLSKLKENNPEVGSAYDSLIEESSKKIIHSSGICLTIKETFNQRELWNEGIKTAWKNLTTHYPDNFSDSDEKLSISNLDLLANISTINSIIDNVKDQKETILKARQEEFIQAKTNALIKYKKSLLSYINEQVEELNNTSIDALKTEQKKLKKIKENVSDIIDEEYYEIVDSLEINIKNDLNDKLKSYFREAKDNINDAEETRTESYEKYVGRGGLLWLSKKYETRYRDITTVRTGAIKTSLENLTWEIEESIDTTAKSFILDWKKQLSRDLIKLLRDNVNDEDLNVSQIKKVIRNVLNTIVYPELSYTGQLPSTLSANGTLEDSRAEEYMSEAQSYVSSLNGRVKKDIKSFLSTLLTALKAIEMSKSIFGNYDELLQTLEEQINNKEITFDKFNKIKNELEKVA